MPTFHNPTCPIFNAEMVQAFLAMVTDPTYNMKARPSQEQCNRMLDFILNLSLPYLPHGKKLAH
jgi:hypothetical protein